MDEKSPYQKIKNGVIAREKLKLVSDGSVPYEDMRSLVGNTTAHEIYRIVMRMRFPTREYMMKDGKKKEIYPMEGKLTKDEYETVKDLVSFDVKRGKFITEKPMMVIQRLSKARMLKGDRFSALKYAIAVSSGDIEMAKQTADFWKIYMQTVDEGLVDLLRKARFTGRFEDFVVNVKNKANLQMDDMMEKIHDMPPIYRATFVDENNKKYVVLTGGYGAKGRNVYSDYVVMWDENVMNENASKVINSFLLGSIDNVLFSGVGRLVEQNRYEYLLYYLMDYTKFSLTRDEITHKYILMAGIEVDDDIAIPIFRDEFASLEEARMFVKRELIPKYMEASAEYEKLVDEFMKKMEGQMKMMKEMYKEPEIGGMYG